MEFLFELVFEIFGELILQLAFQLLAEAGMHVFRNPDRAKGEPQAWKLVLGYTLLGLIVGGVSLIVFPDSLAHSRPARVITLLLSPVATGLAMAIVGALRRRRGQQTLPLDRFAYGYLFALATAMVRFIWTE